MIKRQYALYLCGMQSTKTHKSYRESENIIEVATTSKKMGVMTGYTRHFSISDKLRINDPLAVTDEHGFTVTKRIIRWIEDDPVRLWHLIYDSSVSKSCSPSLCYDALNLLKQTIQEVKPELLVELERKKLRRTLLQKSYRKINRV